MLSPKAKYLINFYVYKGINDELDMAIKYNDKSRIELLEEVVNYYNDKIVLSGKFLSDKLKQLKTL